MELSMLAKGGSVMYVLLAVSIYAVAVIIYKGFQFAASGVFNSHFIAPIMEDVKRGELTAAE
jgi:hypothetical protein